MNIYVASSWRNEYQNTVVQILRDWRFEVYDFKNPKEGDNGFYWSELDPNWQDWTTPQYVHGLKHPLADVGFASDIKALDSCDACVIVLPCGRSAHLEAGWACGQGKHVYAYIPPREQPEPELMYKMFAGVTNDIYEIVKWLRESEEKP